MDKTLLIFDGHSFAYRAFFAIPRLNNSRNEPTNAIFGFLKMLGKFADTYHPTHWTVTWDCGLPESRLKVLETYKAQRKPMPDDLRVQLAGIRQVLEASRVVSLEQPGHEADDIIAALCRQTGDARVLIASSDKDLMQLVNDRVGIIRQSPKGTVLLGASGVRERYGVAPGQMLDLLCLTGDNSDNIPGVPGIGEKTAAELLGQFGSLDVLMARTSEVKSPRIRAALESSQELLRLNKTLMTLNDSLPVTVEWDKFKRVEPDYGQLAALFERFEFKTLMEEARRKMLQAPQGELAL